MYWKWWKKARKWNWKRVTMLLRVIMEMVMVTVMVMDMEMEMDMDANMKYGNKETWKHENKEYGIWNMEWNMEME
jgi:hypothetical protein